jgi:hypothetical protein
MKHRPLDLDLEDPEMLAARVRLADEVAAQKAAATAPPADDLERRIAQARAAAAPAEARGFWFVPGNKGKFDIFAITDKDLAPKPTKERTAKTVNDPVLKSH